MKLEGARRALFASIFARGWAAALALFAVPFYLQQMGPESYGIVGVFASTSALLGFMDLGLGATLTRELARVSADSASTTESRDVLRTFELVYASIAVLLGSAVIVVSEPVAIYWVQAESLTTGEIARALTLAGVALALQWPGNLYSAGLAGLHKQVPLGMAIVLFATMRLAITLTAVWNWPGLESFFAAQICSALVATLGLRWLLWSNLKAPGHAPKWQTSILKHSLRFARGMTGITVTSIVLTQTDKVILSKVLSLSDFGMYVVASTLATGLYMLISPLFSVIYPRFASLVHSGDRVALGELYHTGSQAMALLIYPLALVVAAFSRDVLFVWTGDDIVSQQGAMILSFLVIGNACNGVMNIPYALQLANGWTSLAFWVNVFAIVIIVPTVWWAALNFGPGGGAAAWASLNFCYIVISPLIMHRRLLKAEMKPWYVRSVFVPFLGCGLVVFTFSQYPLAGLPRIGMASMLLLYWACTVAVATFLLPKVRRPIGSWARITFERSRG